MTLACKVMLVCALSVSLGFHWVALQTVAWAGMVITYSQSGSLKQAIHDTFDGQHPCAMCKAIQKGRAEEKQRGSQQVNPELKFDFALWEPLPFTFTPEPQVIHGPEWKVPLRKEAPPKPFPRLMRPDLA